MTSEASRVMDICELRRRVLTGERTDYVLFWGNTGESNELGAECLCQWYHAPFTLDGAEFATAEHYMMWSKARLFADETCASAILDSANPARAQRLGRQVRGFVESVWEQARVDYVVRANQAKFAQHPLLGAYLRGTRSAVLAQASPNDSLWGIGLAASHPRACNPLEWPGLNLLGFALMHARALLFPA